MARISVLFTAFKVTVFADGNVSPEKLGETSYTDINSAIENSLQEGDKVVSCNNCSNSQKSSGVYQLTKNVPARRTAHTKASKAGVVFCEVISVKRANGNFDKYYVFESNALNRLKANGVLTSFDAESVILAINKQTSGIYFEIPSAAAEATAVQSAAPEATAAEPAAAEATAAQPAAVETYTYPENGITISLDLKKAVPSDVAPDLSNHIDEFASTHWNEISNNNRATIFNLKLKLNLILETYKNGAYEAHQEELAAIELAIPTNRDSALTESLESRMQPEHPVALSPYVDLSHAATLNLEQAKSMYDSAHSSYLDRLDANQGSNNDVAAADVIAAADALDQAEANYDVAQATVNLILNAMSSAVPSVQPAAPEVTAAQPAAPEVTAAQPAAPEVTAAQSAAPEATVVQSAAPEATVVQSAAPEATVVQPAAPEVTAAQSAAPEATAAEPLVLTLKQKAAISAIKDALLAYQKARHDVFLNTEHAANLNPSTEFTAENQQIAAKMLVQKYTEWAIVNLVRDAELSNDIEQVALNGLSYWDEPENDKYLATINSLNSLLKS